MSEWILVTKCSNCWGRINMELVNRNWGCDVALTGGRKAHRPCTSMVLQKVGKPWWRTAEPVCTASWINVAVYAFHLEANRAFLVRQKRKRRTYKNAVLQPLLRTSSELVKGGKCVSVGNHEEWSWHSQVVMTVLQEQSKPSWYCLEMDVSVWRKVYDRSLTWTVI